jgi:hypothetical protein
MRHDGMSDWYESPVDQPTYQMGTLGPTYRYGQRLPLWRQLADPVAVLERIPSATRRWGAGALLLATAEMSAIARYSHGHPWWALVLAMLLLAPLHAAVAAALLALLGRLTRWTARLLGGTGYPETTTEIVMVFAAMMALPAGIAMLLWGSHTEVIAVLELVLSVVALVLGVRLVARLEALETTRAAVALILPGVLVITLFVVLAVLQSFILPGRLLL